jgi:Abortive infection C-terminus
MATTRLPTLTPEVVHAVEPLASQHSPVSHDQLSRIVSGVGLSRWDPGPSEGKVKRLRSVMQHALAHDKAAGARLAYRLIAAVRASGGFRSDSQTYVGDAAYENLRDAYRVSNYELDRDGELRPRLLEHVPATEQHEALRSYVRRIQQGATDAALVTGTGKDLLEATARHVLHDRGRSYAGHDFPGTLFHAFAAENLSTPPTSVIELVTGGLSDDARERFQQTLYLLGCAVNRLRNEQGTGHGRPFKPNVTNTEAKLAAQAMALISELLLSADRLAD